MSTMVSVTFISLPTIGAYVSPQCLESYNRP